MARARSARGEFAFAEPHWQDLRALVGRYLPNGERLRRLVPLLLAAFAFVAILGFAQQLIHGKNVAFDAAGRQLSLIADNTALNLKDETLGSSTNWQGALAASLPKGATADSRVALLADAEGQIQGRAPLDGSPSGNLLTILGPCSTAPMPSSPYAMYLRPTHNSPSSNRSGTHSPIGGRPRGSRSRSSF
jgi:hypothetical protein